MLEEHIFWKNTQQTIQIRICSIRFILILLVMFYGSHIYIHTYAWIYVYICMYMHMYVLQNIHSYVISCGRTQSKPFISENVVFCWFWYYWRYFVNFTFTYIHECIYMYIHVCIWHAYIQKHTSIRNALWKNTEQSIYIRIHSIQFFLILAVISWGGDNTTNLCNTNAQLHTDGGEGGGEDGNNKSPDARQGLAGRDALKSMGVL